MSGAPGEVNALRAQPALPKDAEIVTKPAAGLATREVRKADREPSAREDVWLGHVDTSFVSTTTPALEPTLGVPVAQLVGPATVGTANTMAAVSASTPWSAHDKMAAALPTTSSAVEAAEALGHRRVLVGEAAGQIHIPELGKVEVRARAHDALTAHAVTGVRERIDVHVRSEDGHANQVLLQMAPEMRLHVQAELPQAAVHVERGATAFGGESLYRENGGNRENARGDEPGTPHSPQAIKPGRGARARFVL